MSVPMPGPDEPTAMVGDRVETYDTCKIEVVAEDQDSPIVQRLSGMDDLRFVVHVQFVNLALDGLLRRPDRTRDLISRIPITTGRDGKKPNTLAALSPLTR